MAASFYVKDPNDTLDYVIDYTDWLKGDTITASTWVVDVGLTIASPAPSSTNTKTTIWLSVGTPGLEFNAVNHITTAQGRQKDQTITILVEQQ